MRSSGEQMRERIVEVFDQHKQRYGSPRVTRVLQQEGFRCGENRVARLMREQELAARRKRAFRPRTTVAGERVAPNRIKDLEPSGPDHIWVSEITYVATREGWLYLAVILDRFSRKVVGWSMRPDMQRELVLDALDMAWLARNPGRQTGLIFHSDRGSQYASDDFSRLLKRHGIVPSMSRKGNCWDNAPTESFFATLKRELIHRRRFASR